LTDLGVVERRIPVGRAGGKGGQGRAGVWDGTRQAGAWDGTRQGGRMGRDKAGRA
jgi:hypothetical protein